MLDILKQIEKSGIETDLNKRREEGIKHHPKAEQLSDIIGEIEFAFCDESFDGFAYGDGEVLTYVLDIFFEFKEKTGFKLG